MHHKCLIISILLAFSMAFNSMAQPREDSYTVWFPVSGHHLNAEFRNNRVVMDSLYSRLRELKTGGVDTLTVRLYSISSPDGNPDSNKLLSFRRSDAVGAWLMSLEGIPHLDITAHGHVSSWEELDGSSLEDYRRCDIMLAYVAAPPEPVEEEELPKLPESVEAAPEQPESVPVLAMPEPWHTSWYLKTNFLTYPLNLTANIAVEVEIGRHFSLSVPFYYSAMDWFKSTIKFRMSGFQPEVRYWFRDDFKWFFAGAHLTFGWFNVAVGGRYRYQDHATNSPVLGGGINAGYRLPLGRSRWAFEFSLGAGYLPLHYDTFYNVENGALVEEGLWKHYWGIDHVAVTLSYRFGKRR